MTRSLECSGKRLSNQASLWTDVAEYSSGLKVHSTTGAMDAIYQEKRVDIETAVSQMRPFNGQVGAVFSIDDFIVGMELFDSQSTLQQLLPKIVRSYAVETLTPGNHVRPLKTEDPRDFLEAVASSGIQTFESPGLGQELRLRGERIIGAAIVHEDVIIHLNAFRTNGEGRRSSSGDHRRMTPLGQRRRNRAGR